MIRLATPADAPGIAAIYAPFVERTATSFEMEPPSAAEMAGRLRAGLAHAPWLVEASAGGDVLGYAYASRHRDRAAYRWSVDTSVYVAEAARRKGIARALYQALFALLRAQGFYTAHAGISLPNPASVGFHEALGFRPVGVYRAVGFKLGAWHDVGWWQLPLRERTGEPAPPVPLPQALDLPAFRALLGASAAEGRG
jgi:L-amino acid N-acyltransferase YncA